MPALLALPGAQGVDVTRRELYLCDRDFGEAFAMSREEFNRLPRWKQNDAKRREETRRKIEGRKYVTTSSTHQ